MSKKSIKSAAVNNVAYTGVVTLSRYTNGKKAIIAKVHNAGGRALFAFLAGCLIGDFDKAKANLPTKILLLNKDAEDGTIKAANAQFKYLLANPELVHSTDKCVVRYSFIIPQEYMAGTGFNAIGLYPSSASGTSLGDYVALCEINSSRFNLAPSSVLVLDWELRISNGEQR